MLRTWFLALAAVALAALAALAEPAAPAGHTVEVATQDTARVGETRALSLTIAATPGHSISRDGPLAIDLAIVEPAGDAPAVVSLPRTRYDRSHAADTKADAPRFDLRYRARAPGHATVRITAHFWVCGERVCWPVIEVREIRVEVTPAL